MAQRTKRYKFDGERWNVYSKRYQTRRLQEKEEKKAAELKKLEEYKSILDNCDQYDEETIRITRLRYTTLLKNQKVEKKDNNQELLIPVRSDPHTVYFIREGQLFKSRWVDKFGKEKLQNLLDNYKKLLHLKPISEFYWNPF
jgi:hypothetical protein